MQNERSLLDLTVRELLDSVAARTSAPGGGAAAALTTALAAALTGMAARFAAPVGAPAAAPADRSAASVAAGGGPTPPDAASQAFRDTAAQADELRARAAELADADAAAYGAFLAALRRPRDDPGRRAAIEAARDGAAAVPGEVASIAAAVSDLASDVAGHGNPNLRGDAVAAVLLASAAAASAAELVAENLRPGDPRITRAHECAARAAHTPHAAAHPRSTGGAGA